MAAKRRRDDEYDQGMSIAWHTAWVYFKTRAAKGQMPELKSMLAKRHVRPLSKTEMRGMLHQIAGVYGLKVKKRADFRKKARKG